MEVCESECGSDHVIRGTGGRFAGVSDVLSFCCSVKDHPTEGGTNARNVLMTSALTISMKNAPIGVVDLAMSGSPSIGSASALGDADAFRFLRLGAGQEYLKHTVVALRLNLLGVDVVGHRRRDYPDLSDVSSFRRNWTIEKARIRHELYAGRFRFGLLDRIGASRFKSASACLRYFPFRAPTSA